MNFAQPLSADTLVSAAVKVVFPWSMCPMVPTFTCGLLRSNFSLAMSTILVVCAVLACDRGFRLYRCSVISAREAQSPRLAQRSSRSQGPPNGLAGLSGADDQNRTGDLVLTKDALCQLSYIGLRRFAATADKSAVFYLS